MKTKVLRARCLACREELCEQNGPTVMIPHHAPADRRMIVAAYCKDCGIELGRKMLFNCLPGEWGRKVLLNVQSQLMDVGGLEREVV